MLVGDTEGGNAVKETTRFHQAITAVNADLQMAINHTPTLNALQDLIDEKVPFVMDDLDAFNKFEYLIRHGKLKIMEVDE